MARRVLIFLLIFGLVGAAARAQEDTEEYTKFFSQLSAKLQSEDIEGAVTLIEKNPELALGMTAMIAEHYSELDPQMQKVSMYLVNLTARTLEVRLGDARLTQELTRRGVLSPLSTWDHTSLAAKGAPVTSLLGPNAHQDIDLVVALLRLGDYQGALKVADALSKDHPEQIGRLLRYSMAGIVGMGVPNQALPMAEKTIPLVSDPQEKLALELMATYCAMQSGLPARAKPHLKNATALAAQGQGAYGQVAQFLVKSWAFAYEVEQNPNMSFDEIVKRHDEAWKHLTNLPGEHREELTTELYWVGEAFWDIWVEHVLALWLHNKNKEDPRYAEMIKSGFLTLTDMSSRLGNEHVEATLSTVIASLKLVGALQDMGGEYLTQARGQLKDADTIVPTLHGKVGTLYGELRVDYADLLARKKITIDPDNSASNIIVAGLHLLNARQVLEENDDNQTISAADVEKTRQELLLAETAANSAQSVYVQERIVVAELDLLEKARSKGWEQEAEKLINDYLQRPYLQDLRMTQAGMLYRRGKLRSLQKRNAEAVADYQKAIDIFEAYIREIGGGPETGGFIRLFASDLYEAMAKAQLDQGKNGEAFSTIGRLQQAETAGVFKMDDLRGKVKSEDQQLVTRAQEQKGEIEAQEKSLANLKNVNAPQSQIQHASQLVAQSRESYFQTVTDLQKKYPAFEKLDIKPINFSKLQRAIPANTLVVLLFPTEDQLYLMEATSDSLLVRQVAVKRTELDALATSFRQQVIGYSRAPGPFSWKGPESQALKHDLGQLYDYIVKPLEADMKGKEAIAFVPYGSLVYMPFQAFLTQNPDGGVTFLVEKMQVVVLSKAADLDQIFGPPSAKTGSLVAFGNPDGSLEGASQEATALGAIFPGSEVFLGGQATEAQLKLVQAPKVSYLHLATHGSLNAQDPRQSYLTMAKGDKLSVADITGYRLDSAGGDLNLVTLSACQTALADRGGAADGSDLRSLADAFSFAGCRSMVASLWKVEDNSTRDLMVAFYQNLKAGKSKAASLQAAEVSLLKQDKYSHPFFWAAFILIGDWR